jgi:hypothetical protein
MFASRAEGLFVPAGLREVRSDITGIDSGKEERLSVIVTMRLAPI